MDGAARRLYVSHATHVAVVDVDSGKVVGDIPDTPGVHGIAIAPELNRGFVSNGRGNNVTIFDLKTLKAIGQVPTGENPDSIRYDAVSGRVFTFNGRSNNSTAIDAKTGKVAGTIALGGKPEFSVADGKGSVFTNIEDTGEIVVIDAAKLTVTKRYSLSPCQDHRGWPSMRKIASSSRSAAIESWRFPIPIRVKSWPPRPLAPGRTGAPSIQARVMPSARMETAR